MSVRKRRVESEWALLVALEGANPDVLTIVGKDSAPVEDTFRVVLHKTHALMSSPGILSVESSHPVRICLPRFFPSVPSEIYLEVPVFHPNVDPENGFVCLWSKFSIEHSVAKSLQVLQTIISWHAFNWHSDHLMQTHAKLWYESRSSGPTIPLEYAALQLPEAVLKSARQVFSRRRLTEL